MKFACFTTACMDHYLDQNQDFPGGEAVNIAVHLRNMGLNSAYIGAVGTDEYGDEILGFLGSRGIDITHAYRLEGETAQNGITNLEHGEKYEVPGTWVNGAYKAFRMNEEDWKFISTFDTWITHIYCPGFGETLNRVPENTLLAADFLESGNVTLLETYKQQIDFAFFSGPREIEKDLKRISETSDCICNLTLGSEGSMAFARGEKFIQEALPAKNPVDSTGCGDAYIAGFVGTYMQTRDIQASMLKGAELGRDTVEHYGAVRLSDQ